MSVTDGPSLERYQPDPAGLDFHGLRQAGIKLLQELCGELWSDYNLHDPGITMLEHLCYGLTDLVYRSRFEPEDYLFGADGRIDGHRHALLPPEEALPCAPLTLADYQKLFADALPEIRNVWIAPAAGSLPGLLDIHLQLADTVEEGSDEARALLAEAADLYYHHRNLCEDLGRIGVVGHLAYRLAGEIEIDNSRPPAEVLADIYFACATAISPPIPQRPYHDLADGELDRLFEGPLARHGHIDGESLRHRNGASLSELVRTVGSIDGVARITSLALIDEEGRSRPAATGAPAAKRVPRLVIPRQATDQEIRLRKAGQAVQVAAADFLERLDRLGFAAESRRHGTSEHEPVSPLPTGVEANFGRYTSIQHHFPPVYGIGVYGLPASAPAARKAQARQLQAYLLLFEQLMIDFQQGLAALPSLFSTDETLDRSYFRRVLDEGDLPGVERLYRDGPAGADAALGRILARLDDFGDRRSRALDFLLALHGEKFDQRILRNFVPASPQAETRLIRAKIDFLRHAPRLNARRMGAFDYRRAPAPDNAPALTERIALLLDLPARHGTAATEALRTRGYRHLRDDDFLRESGIEHVDALEGAEEIFPLAENPPPGSDSILARRLLCPALMNSGTDLGRYRIVAEKGNAGSACALYFAPGGDTGHWRLSRHADKRAAVAEANRLARSLNALVAQTLGFHLVEHLLLRPSDTAAQPADAAFHAFRMSAIVPAWSARLGNPEFRNLVEQTISRCAPAHIAADVLWLDFEAMALFERLHGEWLRHRRDPAAEPGTLDRAARTLALFLQRQAPKPGEGTRWL